MNFLETRQNAIVAILLRSSGEYRMIRVALAALAAFLLSASIAQAENDSLNAQKGTLTIASF
jgi:hypothetical protein